jgi:hypothetical protein
LSGYGTKGVANALRALAAMAAFAGATALAGPKDDLTRVARGVFAATAAKESPCPGDMAKQWRDGWAHCGSYRGPLATIRAKIDAGMARQSIQPLDKWEGGFILFARLYKTRQNWHYFVMVTGTAKGGTIVVQSRPDGRTSDKK